MPPFAKKVTPNASVSAMKAPTKGPAQVDHSWVEGVKALVFGEEKSGKSRLATTMPKPMLFIATEEGTKSLCLGRTKKSTLNGLDIYTLKGCREPAFEGKIDWVRVGCGADMDNAIGLLKLYKSACLDHGTGLNNILLKEVLGLEAVPIRKSWGMADRGQYGACGMQWCERVRAVYDLCDNAGLNFMVLCHQKVFKPKDESVDFNSDLFSPKVGASLGDATEKWVCGAADYIMQTFVREQTQWVEQELVEGVPPEKIEQKTGKLEYCLRIQKHPSISSGFRSMLDNDELPPWIVNPRWEKIASLIAGQKMK